jgi:hypothetical protein
MPCNQFSLDITRQNNHFWELLTVICQLFKNEATHVIKYMSGPHLFYSKVNFESKSFPPSGWMLVRPWFY